MQSLSLSQDQEINTKIESPKVDITLANILTIKEILKTLSIYKLTIKKILRTQELNDNQEMI